MPTLSICMIVRDEESVLERCLKSIECIADEIIIVDTGSTDKTKEIASRYTDKIYDFEWIDDFSAARNYSFSKATQDYIMWLDADDVFPENQIINFFKMMGELTADVVMLPYWVDFDESGNITLSYFRERIVRRSCGFKWAELVHEHIQYTGYPQFEDIPILHKPVYKREKADRNLLIYREAETQGKHFTARALYYFGRELKEHGLLCEAIKKYTEFLQSGEGWIEDNISACIGLSECYLERNQTDDALMILFASFAYDTPRPETCCRIGDIFMDKKDYKKAMCWFEQALNSEIPDNGFVCRDYLDYYPHMQLCVCYYHLGDVDKSIIHNEKAGKAKPQSKAYLFNVEFFQENNQ